MAVSKMTRLVLLMETSVKNELLQTVQEFQAFEPIAVTALNTHQALGESHLTRQELDSQFLRIQKAQSYLRPVADKKTTSRRFRLTAQAFEEEITAITSRDVLSQVEALQGRERELEKALKSVDDQLALVKKWQKLPFLPKETAAFKAIYAVFGTLPEDRSQSAYQTLLETSTISLFVERLFQKDWEVGVGIYVAQADKEQLTALLEHLSFTPFTYPYALLPNAQEENLARERETILKNQKKCAEDLKALGAYYSDLMLLEEAYYNRRERQKANELMASGKDFSALTGWVTVDTLPHLQGLLQSSLPEGSYVCLLDDDEVAERDIPIVLTNHPLVAPFELLTEMYSLPKYSEIDPTPLLAPFYAIFFGMMVADIGYGLLLLLGSWYLLTKTQASQGLRKNYKLFHLLSYPTILWGVFFGSFFGVELPFHILSTTTDVITILVLSVVFGLIQLLFGLMVNTHIQLKEKNYPSAVSDGLGWIGLLLGVILLVIQPIIGNPGLLSLAKGMIVLNALMIVLGTVAGSERKVLGIGSGLYKLYGATSYIGDIASYTRLMALCVSGASIAASFNMVVGLLPAVARFTVGIPLLLALQLLNFGMSLLGAYVHAVRLQFVEFFGKFYEGGGRAFNPLKTYEKYTDLETRKLEK